MKYKRINAFDNDVSLINKNNSHTNICSVKFFIIYTFLFIILVLQSITLNYFIMIGNILEKFDDVNVNEINNYINKTRTIIDYVCSNLIKC